MGISVFFLFHLLKKKEKKEKVKIMVLGFVTKYLVTTWRYNRSSKTIICHFLGIIWLIITGTIGNDPYYYI